MFSRQKNDVHPHGLIRLIKYTLIKHNKLTTYLETHTPPTERVMMLYHFLLFIKIDQNYIYFHTFLFFVHCYFRYIFYMVLFCLGTIPFRNAFFNFFGKKKKLQLDKYYAKRIINCL